MIRAFFLNLLKISSLVVFVAACSDGSKQVTELPPVPVTGVDIGELNSISIKMISGSSIDFGSVDGMIHDTFQEIEIRNTSSSKITFDSINIGSGSGFESTGFRIQTMTCGSELATGASCKITVAFSNQGLFQGNYNEALIIKRGTNYAKVPLTATIANNPHSNQALLFNYVLTMSPAFNSSTGPTRRLIVTNTGPGIFRNLNIQMPTGYDVWINRCPQHLNANRSCYYEIIHKDYAAATEPPSQFARILSGASFPELINLKTGLITESYTPIYSDPPNNLIACAGTVNFPRNKTCIRDKTQEIVANALCTEPVPTVTYQSPAGSINVNIANGVEVYSCPLGSSTQTFSSRICNSNYVDYQGVCSAAVYSGVYSAFPANNVPNACDGTQTVFKTLERCLNQIGQIVSNSLCPLPDSTTYQSPAGNINVSILNGTETYSCPIGSTNRTLLSVQCNPGFVKEGNVCNPPVYTGTYGPFPPNTVTAVCSGSSTVTKPILSCRNQINETVSNSFCPAPESTTYQSPAGTLNVTIPHGSEFVSCPLGSNAKTIISRTCDSGYLNDGTQCSLPIYTGTYSGFPPNNVQAICSGTQTASQTILTCKNQLGEDALLSLCPPPQTVTYQSPPGSINVPIPNGSREEYCALGSTDRTVINVNCNGPAYVRDGNVCIAEAFVGNYAPAVNPVPNSCDGTTTVSKPLIPGSCVATSTGGTVSDFYCPASQNEVFQSPAGNREVSIANGREYFYCEQGSETQTFSSRSCNSGFLNYTNACVAPVYTGTYSAFPPSTVTSICAGSQTVSKTILSCVNQLNEAAPNINLCPAPETTIYLSPAGEFPTSVSIANGVKYQSCAEGSPIKVDSRVVCNSNFYDNGSFQCVPPTYQVTSTSAYPPNTVTAVCSGTQTVTRTITGCTRQPDGVSVATSFCAGLDPDPSRTYNSPYGTRSITLSHGTKIEECLVGAQVWTTQSISCNANEYYVVNPGYTDCQLDTILVTHQDTHSISLTPCGGTQTILENISTCFAVTLNQAVTPLTNPICSPQTKSVTYNSVAGTKSGFVIPNGLETRNCPAGATTGTVVSRTCNPGFVDNGSGCSATPALIDIGMNHGCAVLTSGKVQCWGVDTTGSLGTGVAAVTAPTPVSVKSSDPADLLYQKTVTNLSAGNGSTCAVANGKLYCWGSALGGQLGNAVSSGNFPSPIEVRANSGDVLFGKTITQVSISKNGNFGCAMTTDNNIGCWGSNTQGQLGNNTITNTNVPVLVKKTDPTDLLYNRNIVQVSVGNFHSCALDDQGYAYCWGRNIEGQLGNSSTINSRVPVMVSTSGVMAGKFITKISTSDRGTCAVSSDGEGFCWGLGTSGQLGNGMFVDSIVPVKVSNSIGNELYGKVLVDIKMGQAHACATSTEGKIYCWGLNNSGQLGINSTSNSALGAKVIDSVGEPLYQKTVSSISAGLFQSCAITSAGAAMCWGRGIEAQLGDGVYGSGVLKLKPTNTINFN